MLGSHHLSARTSPSPWTCFKASLIVSWQCFADTTSFHGLKYLCTERKTYQKFIWLICILVSFGCLITLSYYLYFYYMRAPTKSIIRTQHHPSSRIPFPAVTVCPANKFSRRKATTFLRPFLQHYRHTTNTSVDVQAILRATIQMNDPLEYNLASDQDMELLDKILEFTRFKVADYIGAMSAECNETFTKCIWNGTLSPCGELFRAVLTSEGFCCSFNYDGVNLEKYNSKYSTGYSLFSGLSVIMPHNIANMEFVKNTVRVKIHDPFTFPENVNTDFLVSTLRETAISMRIVYSLSHYRLRELSPKTRNCVFRDEYQLDYFQSYTYENCLTECQMKHYYRLCGCIPHYLSFGNEKVCLPSEMSCIVRYSNQLLAYEKGKESLDCVCPNECDMFVIKTSLTDWNIYPINESRIQLYKGLSKNSTIIHTYFGQSHNDLYDRVLAVPALQFTSNIGGITLLFFGGSFISIVEVIYYFVYHLFRIFMRIRNDTRVLFLTELYLEFITRNKW